MSANWKKIKRGVRRPFETGGFVLLKWLIPLLPRGGVTGLAHLCGRAAMLMPLREKTIGLQNLDAVYGDALSKQQKRRILAGSLGAFTLTMLDVFWFARNPARRIPRYVDFPDQPFREQFLGDRPVVCITAHMGNWEVMGQALALMGVDMASIAATVKNRAVNRILIELRERTGQTIIPQQGALRTLIARFRNNGKAAFVLDQNTSEREGGIEVDFLGLPMPVSPAPAALAYRTGTVIMIGICLPEPGGHYRIHIPAAISPPPYSKDRDADDAARLLTQEIQDRLSEVIRAHPECWLWSYKHWRRVPGRSYPERYPDYP
jgi:KDO2-lipid IV(A) lauroyltransferase